MSSTSTGDPVFVILIEDRHTDVDPSVFADETEAIAEARRTVQECARNPEDIEESALNDDMVRDGWVYYATYSIESDSVRVVRRDLR